MPTLKEKNKAFLLAALVVQALLFWGVFTGKWGFDVDSWEAGLKRFAQTSPLAVVSGLVAFLLQGSLASDTKARLIFWKVRGNPYPGSEAFSKWIHRDPRINPDTITEKHAPLPQDPDMQNTLWYKLLKKHEAKPSIEDAHGRYLLARDFATNWLLFGVIACVAIWWGKSHVSTKLLFVAGTILGYILIRWVARNHGVRLVTSVLAAEGSE